MDGDSGGDEVEARQDAVLDAWLESGPGSWSDSADAYRHPDLDADAAADSEADAAADVRREVERLTSPASAVVRVEQMLAAAEHSQRRLSAATAEQWGRVADVLAEARSEPQLFAPISPSATGSERIGFALRAAIADLALRLRVGEGTIQAWEGAARTLRERTPRIWALMCDGRVVPSSARTTADLLDSIPVDPATDAGLEDALLPIVEALAPARYKTRARVLRDRIHPEPPETRHATARDTRHVRIENDPDGMCTLTLHLPAVTGITAWHRIDGSARHLRARDGESRTLEQIRADVAGDLLTRGVVDGLTRTVELAVTVPVLNLLGRDDGASPGTGGRGGTGDERGTHGGLRVPPEAGPATVGSGRAASILEGYGPIDPITARELAGEASGLHRILTHPVTGAILDLDRTRYRIPAELRRWARHHDRECGFPGCGKPAADCDLDHTHAYTDGGTTSAQNLWHLCRRHHRMKHHSHWTVSRAGPTTLTWTSPTGHQQDSDPPPF